MVLDLIFAFAGILGLLVGSFLNVVILRLPRRLFHDWKQQSIETLRELEPSILAADFRAAESTLAKESQQEIEIDISNQQGESIDLVSRDETNETSSVSADFGTPVEAQIVARTPPAPPDLVFSRSHCPQCKTQLAWFENIPLVSFLIQGGKCRHCKTSISWQYPLVEALTGLLTAVVIWKFGLTPQGISAVVFTWILIALSGIDLRTQLLPDQLTFPLLWLGLLLATQSVFASPIEAIVGAALGYLILWSVYWLFKLVTGKEGMGYGDFKLLAALGAWCGYQGLIPILLLSSLAGAIVGSIYLAMAGKDRATPIPFGQWLAIGGWVQLMAGSSLLNWYFGLFPA